MPASLALPELAIMQEDPESRDEKLSIAIQRARTGFGIMHADAKRMGDPAMTLLVFSGDQPEPLEAPPKT